MIDIVNESYEQDFSADVARIAVLGVGGGGGNAVGRMIGKNSPNISYMVMNTDSAALAKSPATTKVKLGAKLTGGLGAGGRPEVGERAAEESSAEIKQALEGINMVFITAGMGGGTGTGAAPVIAKIAREMNILTVGVVTKPFMFEGNKRMKNALQGIENLKEYVDTLIVVPNQKLLDRAENTTTMQDAYAMADDVLKQGVIGISDLITKPGEINVDFADVCTVITNQGLAHFGIGEANNVIEAARLAIDSPLIETSIKGAKNVILNFTSGPSLNLIEVNEAAGLISNSIDPDAEFIFGTVVDDNMGDKVKVTIIATGLSSENENQTSAQNSFNNDNNRIDNNSMSSIVSSSRNNNPQQNSNSQYQPQREYNNYNNNGYNRNYEDEDISIPRFMRNK